MYKTLITKAEKDYELLDSGEGEKLERYGDVVMSRPDPQALWKKTLPETEWKKAKAVFIHGKEKAEWKLHASVPEVWSVDFAGLTLLIKPTAFKHVGLFPEQKENWKWIEEKLQHPTSKTQHPSLVKEGKKKVLNLFGYTGGATLAAAKAGAEVTHVDGSKVAVTWVKENAERSGLQDAPIRLIVDDARAFLKREIKRGNMYDAIIIDPPAFGRGPDGEVWKIEEHFLELLDLCKKVLSPKPLFFLINGYASGYSAYAYERCLEDLTKEYGGSIEMGELTIEESGTDRLLPAGIFARWQK